MSMARTVHWTPKKGQSSVEPGAESKPRRETAFYNTATPIPLQQLQMNGSQKRTEYKYMLKFVSQIL